MMSRHRLTSADHAPPAMPEPHRVLCLRRHRHHRRDLRQLDPDQFPTKPRHVRRPFIDSVDKAARGGAPRSTTRPTHEGKRPIVFITLVDDEVRAIVTGRACKGMVLDMFRTFVEPLEAEFGVKSQPPRRPLLRRRQEPGVQRPHRGHQLLAGARRRPVGAQPGQRRRDPGRRQPQRQDADLAVPGDAARHQGGQLPADPRGLRARQAAVALAPHKTQVLRPDDRPRAAGADPQRAAAGQPVRVARELPLRGAARPRR